MVSRRRSSRKSAGRQPPTGRPLDRLRRPAAADLQAALAGARVPIGGERSWHPRGHFVPVPTLPGRRHPELALHAVSLGQGPAVVLLHGFAQASWAWRHNLDALATRFAVHALCIPGFGWSAKPPQASFRLLHQARRVLAWLDRMAIARAHLVGNSLGGALALQIAALSPDRVDRIVLVNPAGAGVYPMSQIARLQTRAWAPLLALPGVPFGLKLGLRYGAYAQLPIDDDYMAHFLAPLGTSGAGRAALDVARHFNADLTDLDRRLGGVLHPTLVVRGGRDRVVPERISLRVASRLADARVLTFDASGHCPMEEEPARFNAATLRHLVGQ